MGCCSVALVTFYCRGLYVNDNILALVTFYCSGLYVNGNILALVTLGEQKSYQENLDCTERDNIKLPKRKSRDCTERCNIKLPKSMEASMGAFRWARAEEEKGRGGERNAARGRRENFLKSLNTAR